MLPNAPEKVAEQPAEAASPSVKLRKETKRKAESTAWLFACSRKSLRRVDSEYTVEVSLFNLKEERWERAEKRKPPPRSEWLSSQISQLEKHWKSRLVLVTLTAAFRHTSSWWCCLVAFGLHLFGS